MSTISVCLTHYNRSNKLAATLESLAGQTVPPDELLVRDDCSAEDPATIVRTFAPRFRVFKYHRNTRNLGMPGNLNAVVRSAKSDYVANLHDADIFHPKLLEEWRDLLDSNSDITFAFCGLDGTQNHPEGGRIILEPLPQIIQGATLFEKHYLGKSSSVVWGTVMARRAAYEKLLPFKEKYRNWSDVDMWIRMMHMGPVGYLKKPYITLDNTVTSERSFSWFRAIVIHEMIAVGILSYQDQDPAITSRKLQVQHRTLLKKLMRYILGRLKKGQFTSAKNGLGILAAVVRQQVRLGDDSILDFIQRKRL
jgi:glycosyltransferase involved in cell wall biosynthesis